MGIASYLILVTIKDVRMSQVDEVKYWAEDFPASFAIEFGKNKLITMKLVYISNDPRRYTFK